MGQDGGWGEGGWDGVGVWGGVGCHSAAGGVCQYTDNALNAVCMWGLCTSSLRVERITVCYFKQKKG